MFNIKVPLARVQRRHANEFVIYYLLFDGTCFLFFECWSLSNQRQRCLARFDLAVSKIGVGHSMIRLEK